MQVTVYICVAMALPIATQQLEEVQGHYLYPQKGEGTPLLKH